MDAIPTSLDPQKIAELLADLQKPIPEDDILAASERVRVLAQLMESGQIRSMIPLLSSIFRLKGQSYSLEDHFPFEPVFQARLPRSLLLKTGRQVAKSTSLASRGVFISNAIPHFSTLYITPLYEQIRRFSTQYVRPFIDQSPFKHLWVGTDTENSVLQKSFKNLSKMFFSFAYLDADRVRGISADQCCFDEVQDIDYNLLPIIEETMSASKRRLRMFTGTPKTMDNTIEGLWQRSSQAEWMIPCTACGKVNIPARGYDLERMIGPWHKDISEQRPGTICANPQCGKPIFPRMGRWVHKNKKLRWSRPGYHIPQCIMPIHYADPERWSELLAKQQGAGNTTIAQYYNEVMGESYDVGTKLVTKTDLERAGRLPWKNNPKDPREAIKRARQYEMVVMGVDWGGGGEDEISFTTVAILGRRSDGKIDVIYGERLLTPHDQLAEARRLLWLYRQFGCKIFAHDYNGAGSSREVIMIQAGLNPMTVVPMVYYRSAAINIMVYKPGVDHHPRTYYQVDKARSLVLTCQCIKLGLLNFFQYDHESEDERGLMHDFLALIEHKVPTTRGAEIYTIQRMPQFTDDFAHSVNFGACAIWHATQTWPNLAELAGLRMTDQQLEAMYSSMPDNPWQSEPDSFFMQP